MLSKIPELYDARIRLRDLRPNPIEPAPNGRIPKKHRGRAPQNDVRPYHLHASLLAFWLLFHLLAHVGSVQNNSHVVFCLEAHKMHLTYRES